MPQTSSTKFIDSVILSLYNFGANQREEYLLLKLFKTALEEEIYKKVDKLADIVSGNPMVVKLIVGFYKSGQGQAALREILGPLIKQVLTNKDLHINTNPVEIYKQWINAKELEVRFRLPSFGYRVSFTEFRLSSFGYRVSVSQCGNFMIFPSLGFLRKFWGW